jgi:hypothetical protein
MNKPYLPALQFLLILYCFITCPAYSQSIDYIRNSGEYYFGIGSGTNYAEARRNALENLTESISVEIKSSFEQVVIQTGDDLEHYARSVVNTYSSARIQDYSEREIKAGPPVELILFVSKTDYYAIFRQMEQTISDFIFSAHRAENELRISDALRYYYWALVLARSHPENLQLRHKFELTELESLMRGLEDRINRIFSMLRFEVSSVVESEDPLRKQIHLAITFNNRPVSDLDYAYFMGDGFSGLISARNGMGVAMLDGQAAREFEQLRIMVQYEYANKADLEPGVNAMFRNVKTPLFDRAEIRIRLNKETQAVSGMLTPMRFAVVGSREPGYSQYKEVVNAVAEAIKNKNHNEVRHLFTDQGYDIYKNLIASGNVNILDSRHDTLRIVRVGNETMVRSIPMLFAFNNNRERFIENVVFTFNHEHQINSLSLALGDVAINDILSKPTGFGSLEEKYFLIRFMEDYKTAYSLKRLDYIQAIFDDNALIIVGNVVKKSDEPVEQVRNMYGSLSNEQIEYIWLSKSEYIERLQRVFNRNEFINIRFEDNEVRKTETDDRIYGIQIAQHYYSSTYADKGYLFLMIDLKDTLNPKIYVRTWQPEKNPDGSIFGLHDFRF